MTKKKSTAAKPSGRTRSAARAKPHDPGLIARWWRRIGPEGHRRVGVTVIHLLAVALVLVLAAGGLYRMKRWLSGGESGVMAVGSVAYVELENPPAWMPQWLSQAIRNELSGHATREAYDEHLAERVGQRAGQCPWIARLEEVRVAFPKITAGESLDASPRAIVRAIYRFPFAVAVGQGRESYVDFFGFGLPFDQARALTAQLHIPRIVGSGAAPPRPGSPWRGRDVTAALALIERLMEKPYFNEIAEIDVSNFIFRLDRDASQVALTAVNGQYITRIRFGSLPVDDVPTPGEPTLDQKLANLDQWYALNAASLTGPAWLDLRYPDKINYPSEYDAARR